MKKSSLYTTPNNEPCHSAAAWAQHYDGKTWMEIVSEKPVSKYLFGLLRPLGGPYTKWRYVKMKNGKVLDMRHVLVVGMKYGMLLGILIELGQYFFERESFNQTQDYYSNKVGADFLNYLRTHSRYFTPTNTQKYGEENDRTIARHFYNFLEVYEG